MKHDKKLHLAKPQMGMEELAQLGVESVAYVRQVDARQIETQFPHISGLPRDAQLWALFSADGQPLALADHPSGVIENADELELVAVGIH